MMNIKLKANNVYVKRGFKKLFQNGSKMVFRKIKEYLKQTEGSLKHFSFDYCTFLLGLSILQLSITADTARVYKCHFQVT